MHIKTMDNRITDKKTVAICTRENIRWEKTVKH